MRKISLVGYDIYVSTDIVHGWGKTLFEFCCPELGLFINEECVFVLNEADTKHRLSEAENLSKVKLSELIATDIRGLAATIKTKDMLSKHVQGELFRGHRVAKRLAGEK